MSNRYTRVFSQDKSLYTETSPVIFIAGALLKDEQTGNIIAQLKFKSISEKIIKAIKVDIIPHDTSGEVCGEEIEYNYLDLTINRDVEFGSKEPILMPNPNTRAFKVQVKEAVFTDNTKWNKEKSDWTPMDFDQASIAEVFSEPELAKQYQVTFGSDCKYKPVTTRDLWICSCQAINKSNEESCHKCKNPLFSLENYDLEELKNEMKVRLEKEANEAAEKAAEQEKTAKKRKRGVIIGLAITIPIIIVAIVLSIIMSIMSINGKKDSIIGEWNYYHAYYDGASIMLDSSESEYCISVEKQKSTTGETLYMAKVSGEDFEYELPLKYLKEEKGGLYYQIVDVLNGANFEFIVIDDADAFKEASGYNDYDKMSNGDLLYVDKDGKADSIIQIFRDNSTIKDAKNNSIIGDWELDHEYIQGDEWKFSNIEYSLSVEKDPKGLPCYTIHTTIYDNNSLAVSDDGKWEYIKEEDGAQYYGAYDDKSNISKGRRFLVVTDIDTFKSDNEFREYNYISEDSLLFITDIGTPDEEILIFEKI